MSSDGAGSTGTSLTGKLTGFRDVTLLADRVLLCDLFTISYYKMLDKIWRSGSNWQGSHLGDRNSTRSQQARNDIDNFSACRYRIGDI